MGFVESKRILEEDAMTESKNTHWRTKFHPDLKLPWKPHQEYIPKSLSIRNINKTVSL